MNKKVMVLGRFVYGTWYGAMVVFVAVAALLFGLQLANSGFHDIIAWPKGIHIILMEWAHIDVTLPDDARILRCDGSLEYIITIVEANGNRYLFCKRL